MILIWRMWRIIKLFYRRQVLRAYNESFEVGHFLETGHKRNLLIEQETREEPLKVFRTEFFFDVLKMYGSREENNLRAIIRDKGKTLKAIEKRSLSQDLINSCIENGFMGVDMSDKNLLYLTNKGVKFVNFSYFLKEVKQELGDTYAWLVAIIAAIASGITAREIWSFFSQFVQPFSN